ncbi:MAG TPA: sodium-dependent bicarbonate transport family permease [Saprospirales bacterium]|nr:sodium-dependent bicarbonate transport family permease [Saprospirales bacterium]
MDNSILISNLTNPTLLFFILGVAAAMLKSDLEVPPGSVKFISLYLLFSIGFRGGQELAHEAFDLELFSTLAFAMGMAVIIPVYSFFLLKRKLSIYDAGAVAATYGSVSAVTFISAAAFLDNLKIHYGGHTVAAMALMEAPAIIIGLLLIGRYAPHDPENPTKGHIWKWVRESLTNGSVLMVMGSLIIGLVADSKQAEGIKPFTSDIFKGFLAVFLLDMGMLAARRFKAFLSYGMFVTAFGLIIPLLNGLAAAWLSGVFGFEPGNRFMLSVLAASASYIAVPAAMRFAVPKADPGLYIPMALGVTFPFNITIGLPLYWAIIQG